MAKGYYRKGKGKNSWEIIYDAPREPGQKRNQKSISIKGSEKDAQKKLREILYQIDQNIYADTGKMTFGQFLERWLRDYCQINLSQTTIDGYEIIIKKHLIPALGHHKLTKLQPLHLQEYYSKAMIGGRVDGKGRLSARTVLSHHRVIHRALETALRWQLVGRNVADAVEAPKPRPYEHTVYDEKKVGILLKSLQGTRLYIPILLDLAAGLRRGELMALRWKDVDFKKKTITIRQQLNKTTAGLEFKEPKYKSRRIITVPDTVLDELKKCKKEQAKEKLALGGDYIDNDLICCREDGKPWHPNTFSNDFRLFLKSNGLSHIRLHDLRHTHASLLLKQGVHPKIVSERLGHSQIGITMDIYSHLLPGMQEKVAQDLDDQIFKKLK